MVGLILPGDRPMTEDERRGFRIACACFATWGRMLHHEAVKLAGPAQPVAGSALAETGHRMVFMAEALDLTLGRGRIPLPEDTEFPQAALACP